MVELTKRTPLKCHIVGDTKGTTGSRASCLLLSIPFVEISRTLKFIPYDFRSDGNIRRDAMQRRERERSLLDWIRRPQ